tara:strand:- start:21849 stop:22115 length:267 start_codon:yes stop_codon:yes gene_type:complete
MEVEIKADIKHTRKVLDSDKYFMVRIEVRDIKSNLKVEAEIGFIEKFLDLDKFMNQVKPILNKGHKIKILSHIEFKNKEDYKLYKSKM